MESNIPCRPSDDHCGSDGLDCDICPVRISLRPLDLSDIDDFMVWSADERVTPFCTWEPYTNKEDALSFIKEKAIPHPWYRAICLDRKAIGAVLVSANTGNDACRGELGYVLGFKYWGKGIATRAVELVVETIFKDWPHLERLEALVDVENVGSLKVLEKCGFFRKVFLGSTFRLRVKLGTWSCLAGFQAIEFSCVLIDY